MNCTKRIESDPKVSIIIPAYNAHKTIKQTIKSVIETKYENKEIIVYDDCSDYTYHFPEEWKVILIRGEVNKGAGVGRNEGYKICKGDWVIFLDADDTLGKNIFEVLKRDVKEDIIAYRGYQEDSHFLGEKFIPGDIDWLLHGKIFRKSFLEKNHIFMHPRIRLYEDSFFGRIAFLFAKDQNGIKIMEETGYFLGCGKDSITRKEPKYFEKTLYQRIDAMMEFVGQYYELYPEKCMKDLIHHRSNWIEEHNKDTLFLIFDCVKRLFNIEDYFVYCKIMNVFPVEKEEKIYQEWIDDFKKIKLSVCIPVRNSYKYIEETINKLYMVIDGHIDEVEVILSDDVSDIPDYEFLRRKNMRILYNSNLKRMGGNRNRLIQAAKGKWITFLDHDDEITQDLVEEACKDHDYNLYIITGKSENIKKTGEYQCPYHCIELCHGVLYDRLFLNRNNIKFHPDLKTSEDVYFNRRANIVAQTTYGKESTIRVGKIFYRWLWREDSAFFREYQGRVYEEEFLREYIKAFLSAYDLNFNKDVKVAYHVKLIYLTQFNLMRFERDSKNFKKANYKYFMAMLLFLKDIYRFDSKNILQFLDMNSYNFERIQPEEWWVKQFFDKDRNFTVKYLKMAENLPDAWKKKLKELIK